jgi:thiamine pyrophosphokinase
VENFRRILGVLAGGDIDLDLLQRWSQSADWIIAADAGANHLSDSEVGPHFIIGDMDSIRDVEPFSSADRKHLAEQDSTDCDKLLAHVSNEGHATITLIGVEGDLPDHVLAILHSAARSELDVRLAYRRGIGWIVKPDRPRDIATHTDRRLSLQAIEPCEGVHLDGVQWPLQNANLSLRDGTSISNRTEGDHVRVTIAKGAALLFLEYPAQEMPVW